MRIQREEFGVRLRLEPTEVQALTALIADLVETLQPGVLAVDDPVRLRLYPDGYAGDAEAAEAFRDLTEESLRTERTGRAEQCLADLAGARPRRRHQAELDLDAEAGTRWIQVLNDLRLARGTRLGVTENEDYAPADPRDPSAPEKATYAYLTAVQDGLVRALMG